MTQLSYDVAVLGGGVTGVCAAIAAQKTGAKTILVEKSAVLGGICTGGLVTMWCGSSQHRFFKEIREKENKKRKRRSVFHPERLKHYFLERIEKTGVELLLHSTFLEAEVTEGHINSVVLFGKNGKTRLHAKQFIDATGDGDVCVSAGATFQTGRTSDSLCEPVTLMFTVGGVDDERAVYPTFGTHPDLEEKMEQYVKTGKISAPAGHVILIEGYLQGTASVNMTNLCMVNGTDPWDLTRAELFTRKQIPQIISFLRECVPGYENCYLLQTGEYVGVRETRHITCDYCLNEQDIMEGKTFPDWVVYGCVRNFGAHNLTGSGADESQKVNLSYDGRPYTIPHSSMTVCGLDNLLVAGRAICGTHLAHSSYRVMPICMGTGDGAGVAAALAAQQNVDTRSVKCEQIQEILKRDFVDFKEN